MSWLLFFNSSQESAEVMSKVSGTICSRETYLGGKGSISPGTFSKSLGHQSHPAKPSGFWAKASNVSGLIFDGQDVGFTLNTWGSVNALYVQFAHFIEIQGVPGGFMPGL